MQIRERSAWALFAFLPPTVLLLGIAYLGLLAGRSWFLAGDVRVAMLVSGIAPLLTIWWCYTFRPSTDPVLLGATFMVTTIGVLSLAGLALSAAANSAFYTSIVVRHGLFIGAGGAALIAGMLAANKIDILARYPYSMAAAALAITAVTIVAGTTVNGARLWLSLGPMRFQPSEIARMLVAGFVAAYLYERRHLVSSSWRVGPVDLPPAPYLAPVALAVLCAAALLVIQNDLGMAALISLGMVAATLGTLRSRVAAVTIVVAFGLAVLAAYQASPRVQERFAGWIEPWQNASTGGYQFIQADYALAGGELAGTGASANATVVPEVQTDFVLAATGHQFGLLSVAAVIALSSVVVLRCLLNALRTPSGFGALLGSCLAALLGLQMILIAGGSLRVLPLTGVTFPLLSYGGTSMLTTFFALGLIAGIGADSRHAGSASNARTRINAP